VPPGSRRDALIFKKDLFNIEIMMMMNQIEYKSMLTNVGRLEKDYKDFCNELKSVSHVQKPYLKGLLGRL
jgi:hypothetical protein